ncbi:LRRC36 isoform 14 [Pongo abelii]|uniref:LRRC36 isoform 14 n=1 Tax=Pongo abelii TaxID=9601 RepID=A0A2J8VUQ8_PONAB|nr:LRRC36 isoform 14 [Pongo abelii]
MLRPRFLPPDDRTVREGERKAAKLHFSQLGNSENFLLEVEKSSREKTMKNCVTGESPASKVSANVDSRIEMERVLLCCPEWSAVARSRLTATSTSWVQAVLLPQPTQQLGLQTQTRDFLFPSPTGK